MRIQRCVRASLRRTRALAAQQREDVERERCAALAVAVLDECICGAKGGLRKIAVAAIAEERALREQAVLEAGLKAVVSV